LGKPPGRAHGSAVSRVPQLGVVDVAATTEVATRRPRSCPPGPARVGSSSTALHRRVGRLTATAQGPARSDLCVCHRSNTIGAGIPAIARSATPQSSVQRGYEHPRPPPTSTGPIGAVPAAYCRGIRLVRRAIDRRNSVRRPVGGTSPTGEQPGTGGTRGKMRGEQLGVHPGGWVPRRRQLSFRSGQAGPHPCQ